MKKLSKFIYFIFAFAMITCMSIFNPAIDFVDAAGENDGNSITISNSKIAKTVEAGQSLVIPMPDVTVKSGAAHKDYIVVTDRSGTQYIYDCESKKTLDKNGDEVVDKAGDPIKYFTLLNEKEEDITADDITGSTNVEYIKPAITGKGTYSVQYKVVVGTKTYYGDVHSVQVKSVAYSWEFNAENEKKNMIPTITNAETTYALPLPTLVNNEDESKSIKYTADDIDANKQNIIVTKGGADVTADVVTKGTGEDTNIYFTPTALPAGEETETYIIKYVSQVKAFPDATYTVKVQKSYNTEAKLEVTYNAITNYQVGAPVTFPTANVTDKTHNKSSVAVNTTITIKQNGEVYEKLNPNQYTYTFTEKGTYTIVYEVEDVYGNKATSKATSITLNDKKPYLVTYADSYVTTGDKWEDNVNTDVTYMIPNEVGYNGFNVPAIYAKDYVTPYGELKFTRKLVATNGSGIEFDIDSADNGAWVAPGTGETEKYNQVVPFEFTAKTDKDGKEYADASAYAGMTFKLVYSVKDGNNSNLEATATEYTIKVANADVLTNNIDKNLIINFATINDEIDPNADFTFTTATAKEEPTNSELVADERVEVRTYYYYGAKGDIETQLKNYINSIKDGYDKYVEKYGYNFENFLTYVDTNSAIEVLGDLKSVDGKTTLPAIVTANQPKMTIFAVAINDQNQFVIKAQEVAINNTNEDDAPVIVDSIESYDSQLDEIDPNEDLIAFNQNYKVYLPKVSFKDFGDVDKSLQVEAKCYVGTTDQTVGITIEKFIQDNGLCGIEKAYLTTTYAGTYYVVYTATDDAGNTATYISTFNVAETEKAYIEVENGSNISKNVGDEVKLNINLAGNGKYEDVVIDVKWGDKGPSGLGSTANSYKFDKAGTYVATISATYKMNGVKVEDTPSVTVTITVTEPEMKWAENIGEVLTNRTANINDEIELPIISATENGVEINATPKVVFVDKKGKETEVEVLFNQETFNNYYFVADKDGVYKVTYTATTKYNSESKSFTVTCGDYYDPSIIIANNKLQDSTIKYNGKDIALSVKSTQQKDEHDNSIEGKYILTVEAKEGSKTIFSYDINVDLKDTNSLKEFDYFKPKTFKFELSGNSVSSSGSNKWTISGVGSYELKLIVEDDNGNTTTKTIKFNVSSKTEAKKVNDNVVGIVFAILSVVVLGGIILFFALAGKRNKSRRKSIKTDSKN